MKRLLFILIAIVLFSQCISKPKVKEPGFKIHVKVIDKIDIARFKDSGSSFYSVDIELFNNSDTLLEFWSMTCSWQDNWISSNDSLYLFNKGCPSNYPITRKINPSDKIICKGIIWVTSTLSYIKKQRIKLGFVLIKKNEILDNFEFGKILSKKIKERKDIIWSEPFKIDK
jgi:hypothetical protein